MKKPAPDYHHGCHLLKRCMREPWLTLLPTDSSLLELKIASLLASIAASIKLVTPFLFLGHVGRAPGSSLVSTSHFRLLLDFRLSRAACVLFDSYGMLRPFVVIPVPYVSCLVCWSISCGFVDSDPSLAIQLSLYASCSCMCGALFLICLAWLVILLLGPDALWFILLVDLRCCALVHWYRLVPVKRGSCPTCWFTGFCISCRHWWKSVFWNCLIPSDNPCVLANYTYYTDMSCALLFSTVLPFPCV
jgi:hypothetical protein